MYGLWYHRRPIDSRSLLLSNVREPTAYSKKWLIAKHTTIHEVDVQKPTYCR